MGCSPLHDYFTWLANEASYLESPPLVLLKYIIQRQCLIRLIVLISWDMFDAPKSHDCTNVNLSYHRVLMSQCFHQSVTLCGLLLILFVSLGIVYVKKLVSNEFQGNKWALYHFKSISHLELMTKKLPRSNLGLENYIRLRCQGCT